MLGRRLASAALAAMVTTQLVNATPRRLDVSIRGAFRASSAGTSHTLALLEVAGTLDAPGGARRSLSAHSGEAVGGAEVAVEPREGEEASGSSDAKRGSGADEPNQGNEEYEESEESEESEGRSPAARRRAGASTPTMASGDRQPSLDRHVLGHVADATADAEPTEARLRDPAPEARVAPKDATRVAPKDATRAAAVRRVAPGAETLARAAVRAAWRAAGLSGGLGALDGMASRARSSAVLPDLRVRAGRSTDESLRLTPTATDPYRYTEAGRYDVFYDASVTWRLGRLVFADEELAVERLRLQHVAARARVAERALAVLFAWHRARAEALDPALDETERLRAATAQLEAELTLDVLTDGWFAPQVARLERAGR